jgi:hypothetical protein
LTTTSIYPEIIFTDLASQYCLAIEPLETGQWVAVGIVALGSQYSLAISQTLRVSSYRFSNDTLLFTILLHVMCGSMGVNSSREMAAFQLVVTD